MFQYGLMFVIYKFLSLFLIINIEGQYLKDAFYKHMSQKWMISNFSQYAKMYLVYVQVAILKKVVFEH